MKRFRLPKKIHWPGFTVKVEVVSMTGDDQEEWVYDADMGVIRLQKGLTVAQQRYYFSHAMLHVAADYHHKQIVEGATS